jgi:phage baseplate assembly protein gpV
MNSFFGTIRTIIISVNSHNIQTYSCDVQSLTSGELYNNCIMHFPYGMQSYPFIGQRVQVSIISDNNYICIATNAQVYSGLDTKDVIFGRLIDNITIKFTQNDIIIGVGETVKNVIINASNVSISAEKIMLDSPEIICTGKITANTIEATQDVISGGISGKLHTHTSSSPDSPTSPPTP